MIFNNKEILNNFIIKDIRTLLEVSDNYNNSNEYEKKRFIISAFFLLHLKVPLYLLDSIISEKQKIIIMDIVKNNNINDNDMVICFYISFNGMGTCIDYCINNIFSRTPTKCDTILNDIELIDFELLKNAFNNAKIDKPGKKEDAKTERNITIFEDLLKVVNEGKILKKVGDYSV